MTELEQLREQLRIAEAVRDDACAASTRDLEARRIAVGVVDRVQIADQHARITNACIKVELLRDDIGGCERPVLDHDCNRWTKTIDEIGVALGKRGDQ